MNIKELQIKKFLHLNCDLDLEAIPGLTPKEKKEVIFNLKNQEIDLNYIKGLTYFEKNALISELATELLNI